MGHKHNGKITKKFVSVLAASAIVTTQIPGNLLATNTNIDSGVSLSVGSLFDSNAINLASVKSQGKSNDTPSNTINQQTTTASSAATTVSTTTSQAASNTTTAATTTTRAPFAPVTTVYDPGISGICSSLYRFHDSLITLTAFHSVPSTSRMIPSFKISCCCLPSQSPVL